MNEYDAILTSDAPRQQLRQTMYGAVGTNPDQFAESIRLSRAAGLPADVVERNRDAVKRDVQLNQYDVLLGRAPKLAGRMAGDPAFAKLAHDDTETLAQIEDFAKALGQGRASQGFVDGPEYRRPTGQLRAAERSTLGGLIEPVQRGLEQGDRGLTMLLREAGVLRNTDNVAVRLAEQQRGVERFPPPPAIERGMHAISGAGSYGEAFAAVLDNPRAAGEMIVQSVASSAATLVGMVAGSVLGPAGTATGAGAGSLATEIGSTLQDVLAERGVDGRDPLAIAAALENAELMADARAKAAKRGVIVGLFDAATAGLAGRLLAGASGVASTAARGAGEAAIQMGGGAAGERAAQAATGEFKPGDVLMEALGELPTGVVEAGLNMRHARLQAQRAEASAAQLEQFTTLVGASKLKPREVGAFAAFVAGLQEEGQAPHEMFVDAQTLTNTLRQSGIGMQQLREIAPAVADQLEASNNLPGADVRIPLAEFAAAPPDVSAALVDHLRMGPDAMSRAEAQQFMKTEGDRIKSEVEQQLARQQEDDAFKASAKAVEANVLQQLQAANRYTADVNGPYAAMWSAFFSTQAARLKMTPEELFNRYQPKIVAQTPAGTLLDQDVPLRQDKVDVTRGSFDPQTNTIALLQAADLTTLAHESGHFFLEALNDMAAMPNAPAEIAADFDAFLKWTGVADAATWRAMTLEQKRAHHEEFARGFEKYLFEGKSPSAELQGLFQRLRAWMLAVYKQLRALNVELTPEIRGVFDRLLASDEAIAQAQDAQNLGPLFQSAEQAGMTPEEYAAYQALAGRATEQATSELDHRLAKDMRWFSRARDAALKARQKEVDGLRREVEKEVRAMVMGEPVYRAWAFLTGKQNRLRPGTVAPENITGQEAGRLRTTFVKESHPEAFERLRDLGMLSESWGMDPDIVASVFGFTSGDHLIKELSVTPAPQAVIEELTDHEMLLRHGDITSPQALARAADEAVANELRARVIASELRALTKANSVRAGERNTVDVMSRAAKAFAEQVIARQRVRDLRPGQYTAAAARSAKLATQALGKSTDEAALHKRNQLVNIHAARAATQAKDEVQALQKYLAKFDKRIESLDPGYQDQIDQLLEQYDFRSTSLKEVDKRKTFAAWYAEQEAQGLAPEVPQQLLDTARRVSYKDLTVEELRGLADTIKQIEHIGRLKRKLLLAKDQREFAAIADEIASSIVANGGKRRKQELEGPGGAKDWLEGAWASHRKLASLIRQMDGNDDNGPMWRFIGRPMNDRGTMEDTALEKATVALQAIYEPITKLPGGVSGAKSKLYIPEIRDSLTRGGRLAVALNWGNAVNRQRLADGNRWTQAQVDAVLRTLTPTELEFVNKVWEHLDSYWPEVAAKQKRLTGVEPEKVAAEPFVATAADGTQVPMRGGYFPLKYDPNRSDRASQQEAAQVATEMLQGAFTRATTRRGHTKQRAEDVKRPLRLDLDVITQHVTQVVHDLAWHEFLIDTNRLLGSGQVAEAIRSHYGPKVLETMRDSVLGIATGGVAPQTQIDAALLLLRSNVSRATMGASLTTAFLQPFGLTQSIVRIGGRHVLRGMARWGGDAARMESSMAWIRERSDFMRLRSKTFNRELREIRGTVGGKSRAMQVVDAGLFALMQKMQLVADVPTWLGQYEKSKAEGLDEAAAIAMADRAVVEAQGGGATKDLAEVQRKHPMLTQFYSYFSTTLNLTAESTAATDFKNPAAVAGWLGDMALLLVIPAILPSMIMFSMRGGDSDDDKGLVRRMVEWQVSYLLSTLVGVRELTGVIGGFDYAGPPVGRVVGDLGKAGKQTGQAELDEPLVLAYANLLGSVFGLPMTQILRSYRGWRAWDEGKDGAGAQSVLFGPPPRD